MKKVFDGYGWKVFAREETGGGRWIHFRVYAKGRFCGVIGLNSIGNLWFKRIAPGMKEIADEAIQLCKWIGDPKDKLFVHIEMFPDTDLRATFIFDEREQQAALNHEPINWQKVCGRADSKLLPDEAKAHIIAKVLGSMADA